MNILMVSLGCDKNLCDSEAMLGLLRDHGYNITNDETEADCVIVNTCGFIQDAMEESINTLLEMAELKKDRLKYLIACGCLAQRFRDDITKEIPEIDAVVGSTAFDRIVEAIAELEKRDAGQSAICIYEDVNRLAMCDTKKVITSGTFMGYLKIAEGCSKRCTYCAIPKMRGNYRSVPMERLVDEAAYMAEQGIRELVLVAQETTCYGTDLYGEKRLPELISALAKIEGIEWIRLMYAYPEEITDDLIGTFKNEKKLLHYIDMPMQHSEDAILRRMGRKTDRASIEEVIRKLREACPDIAIRTSLIAGFPGETEEEHKSLLAFLDETELDRVGVFPYSREEGTPAYDMPDQLSEEVKNRYRDEIMELSQEISLDKNEALIGRIADVIVEGYQPEENVYVGRTYRDAPGVDGLVFFESGRELMSGSIVRVRITEAAPYDLIGVLEEEDESTE